MSNTATNHPTRLADEIGKQQQFVSLRQEAYLNLWRTYDQMSSEISRLLKEYDLSDPQYNALRILRGQGKPLQVYQIAERMVSAQTDISRLVDRLAAAGLVDRQRSEDDRRVVWVSLTDKAKSVLKKLDEPLRQLHESQFEELSDEDLETLNRLLFQARRRELVA